MQKIKVKDLIKEMERQLDPEQFVRGFGSGFSGDGVALLVLGMDGETVARIPLNDTED